MTSATVLPFDGPQRPGAEADEPATPSTIPSDVAHQAPAAVYTACTGADGAWLYASPQIETILGYSPQEFVDDSGLWARLLHPDDRDWVLADEEASHAPEVRRSYAEYRLIARDGRVVWVLDDITVLHEPGRGSVQHGLLFDITARKRTELAARRAGRADGARRARRDARSHPAGSGGLGAPGDRGPGLCRGGGPVEDGPDRDGRTYVAGATHPAQSGATERLEFADLDGVPLDTSSCSGCRPARTSGTRAGHRRSGGPDGSRPWRWLALARSSARPGPTRSSKPRWSRLPTASWSWTASAGSPASTASSVGCGTSLRARRGR